MDDSAEGKRFLLRFEKDAVLNACRFYVFHTETRFGVVCSVVYYSVDWKETASSRCTKIIKCLPTFVQQLKFYEGLIICIFE